MQRLSCFVLFSVLSIVQVGSQSTNCSSFGMQPRKSKMRVFDLMLMNSELDMLEIHLATLFDFVDHFVICESNQVSAESFKVYSYVRNESLATHQAPQRPNSPSAPHLIADIYRATQGPDLPSQSQVSVGKSQPPYQSSIFSSAGDSGLLRDSKATRN